MRFLNKFGLLSDCQFGFQKGKSIEHVLLDPHTTIVKAIERNEKTACIFLDFAKAFNTVDHDILLSKLEYFAVKGLPLELFRSYLYNKQQTVCIGKAFWIFKQ